MAVTVVGTLIDHLATSPFHDNCMYIATVLPVSI